MDDWLTANAADLGRGIEAGEIDPVDLTEIYLDAIERHPYASRIYARTTADRAREEARTAADRAKAGLRRSPLDGVPISWKDLYDTAGVATEAGSAMLKGRTPQNDATVLQNATEAGLVCLGKTHTTELAFSGLGLNPETESPPNVNDVEAAAGGSSSGAATSVAFGLAAIGIGSDTGGSVRVPSAWNDLVGLKTVHGRLSLEGVVPLCPWFDTVGPLCRSVEDAAMMLGALEGRQTELPEAPALSGLRLACLETTAFDDIDDAPRVAFRNAVERLTVAGAKVEPFELPAVSEAVGLSGVVYPAEAYATWRHKIETVGDLMFPPVRERFRLGNAINAADYIAAWQRLSELRETYRAMTSKFDAVILPSAPLLPPNQQELLDSEDFFSKQNLRALRNTRIGNLLGLAALTIPTGIPSTGLMLQGQREEDLLAIGISVEAALS